MWNLRDKHPKALPLIQVVCKVEDDSECTYIRLGSVDEIEEVIESFNEWLPEGHELVGVYGYDLTKGKSSSATVQFPIWVCGEWVNKP